MIHTRDFVTIYIVVLVLVCVYVRDGNCQNNPYLDVVRSPQHFVKSQLPRRNDRRIPYRPPYAITPEARGNLQQEFLKLFDWTQPTGSRDQNSLYDFGHGQGQRRQGYCGGPLPPLGDIAASCAKKDFFFGMNPKHMEAIGRCKEIMMVPRTAEDAICTAGELRDRPEINPHVWLNSLMSSVLSRKDLSGLQRPALVEVIPSLFVNAHALNQARQMSTLHLPQNPQNPTCVILDGSSGEANNGIENRLWYWREDIMLNSNHWYWHLIYPFMPTPVNGVLPPRPDRRGELFFYFHHSILARYNAERLANGLARVVPFELTHETIIDEPYYTHLEATATGQRWGDRPPYTRIQDIVFNTIPDSPVNITINHHAELLRRIKEAVKAGVLLTRDNGIISLLNPQGIDLLSEVIEASVYSVNRNYYGAFGIHNEGHFFIGLSHDPRGARRLSPGVMTDAATAMRDPAFYRYHTPVAAIFHDHKDTLEPYHPTRGNFALQWEGVSLQNIQVVPDTNDHNGVPNELTTFFNHVTFDLSRGLDFNRSALQGQGPVFLCAKHLDHEPFKYEIVLEKDPRVRSDVASIRVFMAPRFDEFGVAYPLGLQRFRFFPMDFFKVRLTPGMNFITRRSIDSSLTIPWPQRIEELEKDTNTETPNCGCGWPHHLLLSKGTPQGQIFDLFIMATNARDDAVPDVPNAPPSSCRAAPIFCGVPGQLYPDSKPMGYPFDRLPYSVQYFQDRPRPARTIEEYTRGISNMMFTTVRITHVNTDNYK